MSLNQTPSSERVHIGIFGRRNAGKSSLINALTGQSLAIVSEVKGTTTDPVSKAMELLPLGPVVMIDTPGLDDEGALGELRIGKATQTLNKTDIAILVVDSTSGMTEQDRAVLEKIQEKKIPYVIAMNKSDLKTYDEAFFQKLAADTHTRREQIVPVSAVDQSNIYEMKELLARLAPEEDSGRRIVADLISPNDLVVLVVPIDKAAPKGRLILPQQQTIRDILEAGAVSVVVRESELPQALTSLGKKPALVITDSQVFEKVAQDVPADIPLTSFSILFARYKGDLDLLVQGAGALDQLQDGDTVLISEGCTHHRQCEDIGTVKLPKWLASYTGKELQFAFTSGTEFPDELDPYQLILHCGGCMLNEREMQYRLKCAQDAGVPMTNYGTAIAAMHGILKRSLEVFSQ